MKGENMERGILKCKKCLFEIKTNSKGDLMMKDGLCPSCQLEIKRNSKVNWQEKRQEFEKRIEQIRGKGDFDGLVMLSGGKDSIFTAYLLSKIYKLNILGVTIDNGFEYQSTFANSSDIAQKLSISHFIYRLPFEEMKLYYQFLLTEDSLREKDGSGLCFFCGRLLKTISIKIAKKLNVAAVFSGHTEEQIRALGEEKGADAGIDVRRRIIQNYERKKYAEAMHLIDKRKRQNIKHLFEDNIEVNNYENFIYPLQYFEYKPIEIVNLLKKELGWKPDENFNKKYISSGCKLAKIMEKIANINGTVTYVEKEFSDQIRRGSMSKEELIGVMNSKVNESESELNELVETLELDKDIIFN